MATMRALTAEAADRGAMTLDEILAWAQKAKEIGIPGDARPTGSVKLGLAQVKWLHVEG